MTFRPRIWRGWIGLTAALAAGSATSAAPLDWAWQKLPSLPDPEGFSGGFTGVSGGALLFAGGSNFVGKKPWDGGTKSWYDTIYALTGPTAAWTVVGKLAKTNGYGVSVTFHDEVVCVGGGNLQENYADVFALRWDGREIHRRALPALPGRCADCAGALVGDVLYIMGGIDRPTAGYAMRNFWSLDLRHPAQGWRVLEPLPGVARMFPEAGSSGGRFYLFGGEAIRPNGKERPFRTFLTDAYAYAAGSGWRRLADLPYSETGALSPTPVTPAGKLLIVSGDDGTRITLDGPNHPGFRRDGLLYDPGADRWTAVPEGPITRSSVPTTLWRGLWIIPGGERKPGYRSNEVWGLRLN